MRPSSEIDFVSPAMACLAEVWAGVLERGKCAKTEPLSMCARRWEPSPISRTETFSRAL